MSSPTPARTYNQYHVPRKYTPDKRRMSIYWTWSYPWEAQPQLHGIRGVSICLRRRDQKGPASQAGTFRDARPNAIGPAAKRFGEPLDPADIYKEFQSLSIASI